MAKVFVRETLIVADVRYHAYSCLPRLTPPPPQPGRWPCTPSSCCGSCRRHMRHCLSRNDSLRHQLRWQGASTLPIVKQRTATSWASLVPTAAVCQLHLDARVTAVSTAVHSPSVAVEEFVDVVPPETNVPPGVNATWGSRARTPYVCPVRWASLASPATTARKG